MPRHSLTRLAQGHLHKIHPEGLLPTAKTRKLAALHDGGPMPATSPAPDIEIYLQTADSTLIREWLGQRLAPETPPIWRPAGKKQWKTTLAHAGHRIPVLDY
jgi:hypothetical protein